MCVPELDALPFLRRELSLMLYGNQNGKEIRKRGRICIHMSDLLCCTAKHTHTRTTL